MTENVNHLLAILRPLLGAPEGAIGVIAEAAEHGDDEALEWAVDRMADFVAAADALRAIIAAGSLTKEQAASELGIVRNALERRLASRSIATIAGPNPGAGPRYITLIPRAEIEKLR